jgi:hypothetical protein
MTRRTFDVVDVTEISIHWHAGRSQLQLADSLGVDPKTVRSTRRRRSRRGWRPAGRRGRRSDGRSWSGSGSRSWSTPSCGEVSWPEIARYHDVISSQLGAVTVATIHQRLRDEQGLTASLASLRRYVRANLAEEACRAAVTGPRGEVPPGSEGQVDYGLLGRWFDPVTQRTRRVWAFVLVLARRDSRPRPWRPRPPALPPLGRRADRDLDRSPTGSPDPPQRASAAVGGAGCRLCAALPATARRSRSRPRSATVRR